MTGRSTVAEAIDLHDNCPSTLYSKQPVWIRVCVIVTTSRTVYRTRYSTTAARTAIFRCVCGAAGMRGPSGRHDVQYSDSGTTSYLRVGTGIDMLLLVHIQIGGAEQRMTRVVCCFQACRLVTIDASSVTHY